MATITALDKPEEKSCTKECGLCGAQFHPKKESDSFCSEDCASLFWIG